jgi:hypothetical protein
MAHNLHPDLASWLSFREAVREEQERDDAGEYDAENGIADLRHLSIRDATIYLSNLQQFGGIRVGDKDAPDPIGYRLRDGRIARLGDDGKVYVHTPRRPVDE